MINDLINLIPRPMRPKLLFVEGWREPPNFRVISTKQRHTLAASLREREGQISRGKITRRPGEHTILKWPTATCAWVWLGLYAPDGRGKYQPIYNRQRVTRILFEARYGALAKEARLVPFKAFGSSGELERIPAYSDVSPFKYMTGLRNDWGDVTTHAKRVFLQSMGIDLSTGRDSESQSGEGIIQRVKDALMNMIPRDQDDNLVPEDLFSMDKQMVIEMLSQLASCTPEEALRHYNHVHREIMER